MSVAPMATGTPAGRPILAATSGLSGKVSSSAAIRGSRGT